MPAIPALGSLGSIGSIGSLDGAGAINGAAGSGGSFGTALTNSVKALEQTQTDAAQASTALATGQATDPTQVVMAVERAQVAMQMAASLRTKGVEALTEIMRTQV